MTRHALRHAFRHALRPVLATLSVLTAACGSGGPSHAAATLDVRGPWARAADSGTVTAVYLAILNHTAAPVTFASAASPLAESVTLHETMAMNGMVHMMPVDTAPAIAPGDSLVLAEGGKHLMVSGLRRGLVAGDSLPLTLTFADGRTVPVTAVVKSP